MSSKQNWILKNLHLILSVCIVVPTAIIYGSPSILPYFLDIHTNTIDLSNMLKAIMSLYLGISYVWIMGVCYTKFWKIATQLNVIFMLFLALGRFLSMLVEGLPTVGYIFGVIAEFTLGFYSIFQLKKYS
jgi:hypothetical protein